MVPNRTQFRALSTMSVLSETEGRVLSNESLPQLPRARNQRQLSRSAQRHYTMEAEQCTSARWSPQATRVSSRRLDQALTISQTSRSFIEEALTLSRSSGAWSSARAGELTPQRVNTIVSLDVEGDEDNSENAVDRDFDSGFSMRAADNDPLESEPKGTPDAALPQPKVPPGVSAGRFSIGARKLVVRK